MKKLNFSVGIFFLLATVLMAMPEKVNKKLHHDFNVKDVSELVIRNKFGKVDVQNWNNKQVSIDVTIEVDYTNREKAEKLLSYLNVEFSTEGDQLLAITKIDDRFNKIQLSGWRKDGREFRIDYLVRMPKTLDLDLLNKYGDIFIDELAGKSRIEIKYGNLKINKLSRGEDKPLATVLLGYSNGIIDEANWLKSEIKYSKLEITKARAVLLKSGYSKFYLDDVSSLVSESKYDTYKIGHCENFVVDGAYSNYKLQYIGKKLSLETRYTGTSVERVDAKFEKIVIHNQYGGIKLGIDPSASYSLKGFAKYAHISYPENARVSHITENTSSSVEGVVGTNQSPKAQVNIETKYGSVRLIK